MSEQLKTVFITKYAMTDGILEQPLVKDENGMATVTWDHGDRGLNGVMWFYGKDYHHSLEAALSRANAMRLAKIASHERSIAKLKRMRFVLPPTQEGE